jgi:hypothetical protein
MAVNNYGFMHMPKIVRYASGETRTTIKLPALSSAALYLGSFVPFIQGSDAAPTGAELGIPAFADDNRIFGIVVGMSKTGSLTPIWDNPDRLGTVADATGELPLKYTFASTNDEASTTSAKKELVEILPIMPGDILEVATWGGAAVAVARGTTTAAGTTTSSANIGVGMAVAVTYPWAVLESGAAKNLANTDFITVEVDGQKPLNPKHVYVMCIRNFNSMVVAE